MARQQARRHHRERVTGIALAALGAIVLVVALFALREPNGHSVANSGASSVSRTSSAASSSPSRPARTTPGPSLSLGSSSSSANPGNAKALPLVVLNNSTTKGLAKQAAQQFRDGGWTVTDTGNLKNTIISTCAYYDSSVANAKAAAQALRQQFPTIKRVKEKFPELPAGPVVVVLTSDYTPG